MMKPKFTRRSVNTYTKKVGKRIEQIIIRQLQILGNECVNIARNLTPDEGSYNDVTGNLRSSIGFTLYVGDKAYNADFQAFPGNGSTDGSEGVGKAQALALELGPLGAYSLVFVAGMEYAEEVEMRNKDVLTSAYLHAQKRMPQIKADILKAVNAAKI